MKKTNRLITIVMFMFLYLPMAVLIVASFNTGKDISNFEGFTLNRYVELFQDTRILNALYVTLSIAVLAMIVATILGTLAAIILLRSLLTKILHWEIDMEEKREKEKELGHALPEEIEEEEIRKIEILLITSYLQKILVITLLVLIL